MRFRFEKKSQMFQLKDTDIAILPLTEWQSGCWAEIPALVYPKEEAAVLKQLEEMKKLGLTDVVCENIGALYMAKELKLHAHGGMFLNIINGEALKMYGGLGLEDALLSMELSFAQMRNMKPVIPIGAVIYGYLPLMKFRACPGDCSTCRGQSFLTDRLGEKFTLICREKQYSELLNCVPLYVGDRSLPKLDFAECYFTTETKEEAMKAAELIAAGKPFPGRKTAGLYYRELL